MCLRPWLCNGEKMDKIMITVLNFSHPLSESNREYLNTPSVAGAGGAVIIDVPVQVDLTDPISAQVDAIVRDAFERMSAAGITPSPANVDCIVPPGLSIVAVPICNRFPAAKLVALRRDTSRIAGNVYIVSEIFQGNTSTVSDCNNPAHGTGYVCPVCGYF